MSDEEILDKLWPKKYPLLNRYLLTGHLDDNIIKYLDKRYSDSQSLQESLYRIKHQVDIRPICKRCGKPVKFTNKKGFNEYCCHACAINQEKIQQAIKEKYGVSNVSKLDFVKQKKEQTTLKHFGVKNPYMQEKCKVKSKNTRKANHDDWIRKIKDTCMKKYGVSNVAKDLKVQAKAIVTNMLKYGDYTWSRTLEGREELSKLLSSPEIKEKTRLTCLKKYGVANVVNNPIVQMKALVTNMLKYGDYTWSRTPEGREELSKLLSSPEIKEKTRLTCLKKYGAYTWSQSDIGRQYMSQKMSSPEMQERINTTKRNNHTMSSSGQEDKAYRLLIKKYPDIQRQYRSDVYPFNCDFYIPSIDTYIECQFGQFHNYHPYLHTDNDIKEVEELKKKANKIKANTCKKKSRYDAVIETWTVRDVKKRQTAKNNHLNFIEFWSLDELEKWIRQNNHEKMKNDG